MNLPNKEHFAALSLPDQVAELPRVPAKTRQELILASGQSLDLVRSLSSETLFYTLKEIGLTDAMELLALASPEQLRDLMDLDCWRKDRLDDKRLITWLMFLDEAGSGKLAEWALRADVELLVWLVKRHFEVVRKADVEEDPDFNQSRYFTFDEQYLLRFIGDEEPILHLLLERLRVLDYRFYTDILEHSLFELEAPLEEEALRWRTARLADRGYPDFEEAREIFRAVPPHTVRPEQYRRAGLRPLRFADTEAVIPPNHALLLVSEPESFFSRALAGAALDGLEQLSVELAYLTNHVVMAEACDTGELSEVRRCAELVHDVLNIGLEYAAHGEETEASRLVHETQLQPFFQIGWSLVIGLYHQAASLDAVLQKEAGADWQSYVDTPFRETYTGARRRRPVFFQGLETPGEILCRRFRNLADIQRVAILLTHIPHWFGVMRRWGLLTEGPAPEGGTLEVLWNTAFVHWATEHRLTTQPLQPGEVERFLQVLQEKNCDEWYAEFLTVCARQFEWSAEEGAAMQVLTASAREKLQEIIALPLAQLDVRFVSGVLIQPEDL